MTDSPHRFRRAAAGLLALSIVALAGCAATADTPPDPVPNASAPPATDGEPSGGSSARVVTCAEIEPLAAAITGAFGFSPEDSTEDASGTSCVWTNAAVEGASTDLGDYATLGITVDGTTWSADELASLPGATDDARVAAIDGRVLLGADADTLGDAGSVQVLYPEGTVTVVATGALASASADTQIPVDTVIGVAAQVAELRR